MIFRNIITCIDNLLSLKTFGMPRNDFKECIRYVLAIQGVNVTRYVPGLSFLTDI